MGRSIQSNSMLQCHALVTRSTEPQIFKTEQVKGSDMWNLFTLPQPTHWLIINCSGSRYHVESRKYLLKTALTELHGKLCKHILEDVNEVKVKSFTLYFDLLIALTEPVERGTFQV